MRRLKLFLDAKAANTPPRGISKASRVIFSVLTLLFLSIGQVWGANYSGTFSAYTDATLIDGIYVIGASTSASNKNYCASTSVSGGRITGQTLATSNPNTNYVWIIEETASGWTFKNYGDQTKYIKQKGTGSGTGMEVGTTAGYFTLAGYNTSSPVGFRFTSADQSSNNFLKWNNSSKWFANYANAYSASMAPVTLYRTAVFRAKTTQPTSGSFTASATGATWDNTKKHLSWMSQNVEVTLTATPPAGKEVDTWTVTKAKGGTVTVTNNKFNMPADQVTITVTWKDATPAYAITPATNDEDKGTVSITGNVITASPKSGYRVDEEGAYTVTSGTANVVQNGNEFTVTPSTDCTVQINFKAIPAHNINFYTNGGTCGTSSIPVLEGVTYSNLPTVTGLTSSCEYGTFVGWKEGNSISNPSVKPTLVTSVTMSTTDVNLYAVYSKTEGGSTPVEDELTPSVISNPTSYGAWSGKTASSDAVYAGYSTGGTSYIQLRISDNTSGIVSTTSGGNCSKVTVDWNSTTTTSRYVDVYGKNSAYASSADLYDNSKAGTLIGTLSKDNGDTELEISSDYAYIGIRSQTGAIYLNSVTFTWGGGGTTTYSLDANCCTPYEITASGIGGELILAPNLTEACAGTEITLTANSPNGSHQGEGVIKVVETADPENDITSTVYNSGTGVLTMPGYAITITATYAEKSTPSAAADPAALDFGSPLQGAPVAAQTFSLTGSALVAGTLTLVAPSGYTVSPSEIAVSAGSLSATEITVTPNTETAGDKSGNITISGAGIESTNLVALTMNVQETYTVNWYVNGTKIDANSITDIVGTAVTAPSDFSAFTDCQDLTFVGWKEGSAIDGGSTTEAPSLAEVVTTIPAANKDYYAVFAEGTPGSAQWEKATSVAAGEYLIVYETGGVAFDGSLSTLDAVGNTIAVTINDSKIAYSNATEAAKFTIAAKTGGYSIKSASDLYIGQTSDANGLATSATDDYANAISISGGNADIVCSSAYLRYNSADNQQRFRYYKSTSYSGQKAIQLYKKNVSPANFTKWYTTCPHCNSVTLSKAGESAGNTFALQRNSADVTSVNTCEAVTVDVVASPATGYELTNLEVSGVTGASVNTEFTQISIPQDAEGTLTVTATFSQKNYSIAVQTYPASIGATLTGATSTAKYGVPQTISTDEPTGYLFGGWYLFDASTFDAENINWNADLSSEIFTGTYKDKDLELEASFLMTDKNLVAVAYFDKLYTVSEFLALGEKSTTETYYIQGLVSNVQGYYSSKYITYYISDNGEGGSGATTLKIYNGLNENGASFTNINNLTVGDKVIVEGKWDSEHSNIGANNKLCYHQTLSLSSVVVSAPDASLVKSEYFTGETFSYAGLKATAVYNTGYQKDVTSEATFKANGSATLTVSGNTTVNVTAAWNETTSADYPVTITVTTKVLQPELTLSETALTGYLGQALPKPATITAHFVDNTVPSTENVTLQAVIDENDVYDASSTAEQTIPVKYTFGPNEATANYTVTLSSIANTLNTAYSVEKAQEIIEIDKADGNNLDLANADNKVYVIGRVKSVNALTGTYAGKYTIVLEDQTDNTKTIELYRNTLGTGITSVEVGDLVKAYGNLYWFVSGSKYEINEGGQVVWKQPKVSIEISNQTMEVGETLTIADVATIDPAAAPISYAIVANDDNCITLNESTGLITAVAQGTATVSISAEAYGDYLANSKNFTVTVKPAAVHTNVVLYVEFGGNYYAVNNEGEATQIDVLGGKVVVANEATKNKIVWDCAEREGAATFYNTTAAKYLNGSNSTTLGVAASEGTYTNWTWTEDKYYTSNPGASTVRTFLYQGNANSFGNYAKSNAGKANDGGYSNYATIYTGEVVVGTIETIRSNVSDSKYGTICLPNGCTLLNGSLYEVAYYGEASHKIFFDEIINGHMVAGTPYIILPNEGVTELKGVYTDNLNKTTATPANGLIGSLSNTNELIAPNAGNYILYNNQYWFVDSEAYVTPNHAYIRIGDINRSEPALAPGRRRVSMNVNGEQVATGIGNVQGEDVQCTKVLIDGKMYILRGEKMYDATGKLVK